jgi:methionyl-tRNA synthetase
MNPETATMLPPLFIIALIWSFIWKAIALWKAARNNSKPWYIALIVIHTLGILEILYIFIFSKMGKGKSHKKVEEKN